MGIFDDMNLSDRGLGKARGEFSLVVGWAGYNAPFSFANAFFGDFHQLSVPLAFVDPGINHTTRD